MPVPVVCEASPIEVSPVEVVQSLMVVDDFEECGVQTVNPVAQAIMVAPPLSAMCRILRRELSLTGNIADVVDAACEQLGVSNEGNLSQKATACWQTLGVAD